MKLAFCLLLTAVLPYLICGINSAIIVTKIKTGRDIRDLGSGNAGLTNTIRTQGKTAAAFVLIGDMLKGILSVFIIRLIFRVIEGTDISAAESHLQWVSYAAGIFCVLGHIFPIYYSFKGGKGVLVTLSALYAIDPVSASILLGIFFIILILTRYVSLSSIIAAAIYPFCVLILSFNRKDVSALGNFACALAIGILLIYMHRENIRRLLNKTESKFNFNIKNK